MWTSGTYWEILYLSSIKVKSYVKDKTFVLGNPVALLCWHSGKHGNKGNQEAYPYSRPSCTTQPKLNCTLLVKTNLCLFTFYNFNREIDALAYFRPLGIGEPVTILTEFLNHILVWIAGKY